MSLRAALDPLNQYVLHQQAEKSLLTRAREEREARDRELAGEREDRKRRFLFEGAQSGWVPKGPGVLLAPPDGAPPSRGMGGGATGGAAGALLGVFHQEAASAPGRLLAPRGADGQDVELTYDPTRDPRRMAQLREAQERSEERAQSLLERARERAERERALIAAGVPASEARLASESASGATSYLSARARAATTATTRAASVARSTAREAAAETRREHREARSDYGAALSRAPKRTDYRRPGGRVDEGEYSAARASWAQNDSTPAADRLRAAGGVVPGAQVAGAPVGGVQPPLVPAPRPGGPRPQTDPDQAAAMNARIARGNARTRPVRPVPGGVPDAGRSDAGRAVPVDAAAGRRVITQDQADYLRTVKGLSDAEIAARYQVQGAR